MDMIYALARQPGTSHLTADTPCQDFAAGHTAPGAACVVLCDGAGSYAESHTAAEAVSGALAANLAEDFDSWYSKEANALADELIRLARTSVANVSPELKPACTLLLFAAAADGRTLLAHLGDGVIFGITDEQALVLSEPENGEEANQTYFVSGNNAVQHLRLQKDCLPSGGAVLLCSDGAAAALLNYQTMQPAQAVCIMAGWLQHNEPTLVEDRLNLELDELFRNHTDDDMSLALLLVPAAEVAQPIAEVAQSTSEVAQPADEPAQQLTESEESQ